MPETGIGAAVRRVEDYRFLTGRGTYTDDVNVPGQVYARILRSPHAHAKINGVNIDKAKAAAGVIDVLTGADLAADEIGGLPCGWGITSPAGEPMKEPPHPALATDVVRHVGDNVAVVVADSRQQARDAADLIEIDYDVLPAVVAVSDALNDGAPQVHEIAPNNLCFTWEIGDKAATDEAFAAAHHVTKLELVNNRLIPNAIEPRAALGDYDQARDDYTLYLTSQNPHVIRLLMGAFVMGIPEHKLRVVAPDVGGGFGSKIFQYADEVLATWASRRLGRPVKWTADRSESFMTDAHGRDHVTEVELALDAEGKFLGLRVVTVANLGAYLSTFAPLIPTYLYGTLLAGQYTTPAVHCEVKAVFTHTTPVDALRGAGRPEATYLLERVVDKAAQEVDIDPAELRRRNFIAPDAFPYQTPVALTYDSGNYAATLDEAIRVAEYAAFGGRRAEAEQRGKLRGIGFSAYIEACGAAPSAIAGALGARAGLYEAANVRVHPTGSVSVFTGSHSHGQGHETTFAQLVASGLGIPMENVKIVHGDTANIPFGIGTFGSRSLSVGGSAIAKAMDKIIAKGKKIAAHLLEASEVDIEFKDGAFTVAGTDRSKTFGEIALAAYVPHNYPLEELEPGLEESAFYDPANFTFPAGSHICEVEIDPDTGEVEIVTYTAIDDVGRVINPMIVEGQVHGGIAHGVGQALFENCVHDANGQLLTGSYMDYTMPRAQNLPSFQTGTKETLCPHNPLGVKGAGETGTIGSSSAVINAVVNALSSFGVTHLEMPATPERVWRKIRDARAQGAE